MGDLVMSQKKEAKLAKRHQLKGKGLSYLKGAVKGSRKKIAREGHNTDEALQPPRKPSAHFKGDFEVFNKALAPSGKESNKNEGGLSAKGPSAIPYKEGEVKSDLPFGKFRSTPLKKEKAPPRVDDELFGAVKKSLKGAKIAPPPKYSKRSFVGGSSE